MIEIEYVKNDFGDDNCFFINYELRKYIPSVFFEQHEDGAGGELYFLITLLNKFEMFDCKAEHYKTQIWSTEYECVYNGIPFFMIYDEDYDLIHFGVQPENCEYRSIIAERIKQLILEEGPNISMKETTNDLG